MSDCCIPTPDSILEDDEIDVFEQIFPDTDDYYELKREIMWNAYGSRGIGNPDIQYWIKSMTRKYGMVRSVYDIKFRVIEEWLESLRESEKVDLSDSSTGYKITTENEDNPDNPQTDVRYLSDRNTVIYDGKSYGGLSSETVGRFNEYVPDLYAEFADEFRRLFYHGV